MFLKDENRPILRQDSRVCYPGWYRVEIVSEWRGQIRKQCGACGHWHSVIQHWSNWSIRAMGTEGFPTSLTMAVVKEGVERH
jgi:hypothetical protein